MEMDAEDEPCEEPAVAPEEPEIAEMVDASTQTECTGLVSEAIQHMRIICNLLMQFPLDADEASALREVQTDVTRQADLRKGTCRSVRGKGCVERRTRFCCFF